MNVMAIIIAIILNMVIGMIWYSALFGKIWVKANNFNSSELKAGPQHFFGAFCVAAVSVISTALLIDMSGIITLVQSIKLGILLWLGFIVTYHFSQVIWARKPLVIYFIDIGCLLVTILLNTILLTLWR